MGFGRGFGGAPSRTEGGLKRIRKIERVDSSGGKTFTSSDLLKGAIERTVSGQIKDIISFASIGKLAGDLGMSIGDDFDFRVYVDNPNRGTYDLELPNAKAVTGIEYFGDRTELSGFTSPKCIHEFNFFYVSNKKMAVTVSTFSISK